MVLLLFGLALIVMIVALDRIGRAEDAVARLDRAKHAGHQAAAMAREQYMHQAHTMLAWDDSHMHHYEETSTAARHATEHLAREVEGHSGAAQAKEQAQKAKQYASMIDPFLKSAPAIPMADDLAETAAGEVV